MAITNGYLTLAEAVAYTGANDGRADAELEDVVTSVSRLIDNYCGRHFYQRTAEARTFEADESDCLEFGPFNDLVSITTLKTDENGDGTYETTISSSNYLLEPVNAAILGRPYRELELLNGVTWPIPPASGRDYLIQITGTWGWPAVPPEVKQAARIMVAEVSKLADAPLGVAGYGEFGVFRVSSSIPARARQLLEPLRHPDNFGIA
ncbi:MAG: hypothetical protein EBR82_17955 [Caulobacteraceae bacterium]|nr:hypothetical protein [Caulobacteraceae bacterium]